MPAQASQRSCAHPAGPAAINPCKPQQEMPEPGRGAEQTPANKRRCAQEQLSVSSSSWCTGQLAGAMAHAGRHGPRLRGASRAGCSTPCCTPQWESQAGKLWGLTHQPLAEVDGGGGLEFSPRAFQGDFAVSCASALGCCCLGSLLSLTEWLCKGCVILPCLALFPCGCIFSSFSHNVSTQELSLLLCCSGALLLLAPRWS